MRYFLHRISQFAAKVDENFQNKKLKFCYEAINRHDVFNCKIFIIYI